MDKTQHCLIYLNFHYFVPTALKVIRYENGQKSVIKYTIKDSQNTFITFHSSVSSSDAYK